MTVVLCGNCEIAERYCTDEGNKTRRNDLPFGGSGWGSSQISPGAEKRRGRAEESEGELMNRLMIIGNLTADPEGRVTQSGKEVCTFTVAVNRRGRDNGTDFFRVSAWNELAKNCKTYLAKGKKVCVTGEVRASAYVNKNGEAAANLDLMAADVEFLTVRKENPAKVFLRRYRNLSGRIDALQAAINQAMARATNISVSLKEIKVLSSPTEHDPMATDVCMAVDACEILYKYKSEAENALRDILAAVDSLKDERQKEILTMRYIQGISFEDIMEKVGYERTQTYVIHGRGLVEINKWLERRGELV